MRVLLLTDNLNSGGAQRQLVLLAGLLASNNAKPRVACYYPEDFFAPFLKSHGIPYQCINWSSHIDRIFRVRRFIREIDPTCVIAFMDTPSVLAELAGIPRRRFGLIVSERTGKVGAPSLRDRIRFRLHSLADVVVANSECLRTYITENAPWLRDKTNTILNCVDLSAFCPSTKSNVSRKTNEILVVGRIRPEKNPLNLIRAVQILKKRGRTDFVVNWYGDAFIDNGRATSASDQFFEALKLRKSLDVSKLIRFHKPIRNVGSLYQRHSALCLPSYYEGFSNVLCEAAACGRPLLASDVCDNAALVRPNENGLLFDPSSPVGIADAIEKFLQLPQSRRMKMGRASRKIAEKLLSPERYVEQYWKLLEVVARNQ